MVYPYIHLSDVVYHVISRYITIVNPEYVHNCSYIGMCSWFFGYSTYITSLQCGAPAVLQNLLSMDISIIKPILLYDPFGCKLQSNFASDFGHHLVCFFFQLSCYGTKKALTHVLVICQGHGGIRCTYSARFNRDRFCWILVLFDISPVVNGREGLFST